MDFYSVYVQYKGKTKRIEVKAFSAEGAILKAKRLCDDFVPDRVLVSI
jgi:hypothetical protein